jgi:hypothetical protein
MFFCRRLYMHINIYSHRDKTCPLCDFVWDVFLRINFKEKDGFEPFLVFLGSMLYLSNH